MARSLLSDKAISGAKPQEKITRLKDGGGLFLVIAPEGGKRWQYRYIFEYKEKTLSLGLYPAVSLAMARQRRDEAERLLATGADPSAARKAAKAEARAAQLPDPNTFERVARRWFDAHGRRITQGYREDVLRRLEQNVFPYLGELPISQVKADVIRDTVKRIEERGAVETARRQLQKIGQIMRYAVVEGMIEYDPTTNLRGLIQSLPVEHFKSVSTPSELAQVLRAIDAYSGTVHVKNALKLTPMLFVRPGELRRMEWSEVDLLAAEWRIPAEKMKMKEPHIVPLATQAVAILNELQSRTGGGQYVFPGRDKRPMSENAVRTALIAMGFELTAHGFRATASTLLNESGKFRHDAIERQLAHGERNKVRAAYNHGQYLPERKLMMQWWADYLDALKEQGKVVQFPAVAGRW